MKKYYIGKEILSTSNIANAELNYYVLEDEKDDEKLKIMEYGIEIEKRENARIEKSQIKDITTEYSKVECVVKILMANSVTPVHLHDVIMDML